MMNTTEVREELEKALGEPVADSIFSTLEATGYVGNAIDDGNVDELVVAYGAIRDDRKVRAPSNGERETIELPPDRRLEAFGRIVADWIDKSATTVEFRKRHLAGGLLKPVEVDGWIRQQAERDGPPTVWFEAPTVHTQFQDVPFKKSEVEFADATRRLRFEYLETPGWPHKVRIRHRGVLHELKNVARMPVGSLFPSEAAAVLCILTGSSGPFPRVVVQGQYSGWETLNSVTIKANVRTKPQTVADLYRDARESMQGVAFRAREISEKHAELAVFVSTHNDGSTWAATMTKWNRERPEWAYTNALAFTRDGRAAFERVTGNRLQWKGGKR